jgi:uncharacterized protein
MNRLAKESSPYLLQHAHNPVDWYPWGEEALQKASKENKPILVSIGYSACHWCHVMERESFENQDIADIMNAHFINIKVDREERPDLDHIYMDAVQAMTGSGGWPLNVFLTPEGKPFYGGTYFPPRKAFNRPSWQEILLSIHATFEQKRDEVEAQSDYLVKHIAGANTIGLSQNNPEDQFLDGFNRKDLLTIASNILSTADQEEGGFGQAPKFPQTFTIQWLLRDFYFTKSQAALDQALLSLDKMIRGGIYDQVGGGFSRYATDNRWLVPHFEKMLYDNALLVSVISEAFQLTGKDHYRRAVMETLSFIERECTSPDGVFYAALDADSEGEEGKFYVWSKSEIDALLGKDAPLFCAYYGVRETGNWEGKNILHISKPMEIFAEEHGRDPQDLQGSFDANLIILLKHRSERIRPQLDDKILLGWNALMISAYCKAFAAFGTPAYRHNAVRAMDFILEKFKGKGIHYFFHTYKQEEARFPAFLDDYAYLVAALINLQEVTGEAKYLLKAREITAFLLDHFSDEKGEYFYFTHKDQQDVIVRKKEIYDGAVPSGNAIMAMNLHYLSIVFEDSGWRIRAEKNAVGLAKLIIQYPGSFGIWATLVQAMAYGMNEVVILGKNPATTQIAFLSHFIPFRVYQSATSKNDEFPLLRNKPIPDKTLIFLCRDYSCQNPVTEIHELVPLLETVNKY